MATVMKPEDVQAELIDLAMRGAKPGCRSDAAFYLANVLPEYGRMVREQVAREIEAACPEVSASSQPHQIFRAQGMNRAARIVRGES